MVVKFDKNGVNNVYNLIDVIWFVCVGNDSCRESCTVKSDSER